MIEIPEMTAIVVELVELYNVVSIIAEEKSRSGTSKAAHASVPPCYPVLRLLAPAIFPAETS